MTRIRAGRRRLMVAGVATAAALTLAGGVAFAAAGDTGGASGAAPVAKAVAGKRHPRLARGVHGTFTAKDKSGQYVEHVYQRGTVRQASATQLSVHSADGVDWTWRISAGTKVHAGPRGADNAATVGENVLVVGVRSGGDNDARQVLDIDAAKRLRRGGVNGGAPTAPTPPTAPTAPTAGGS